MLMSSLHVDPRWEDVLSTLKKSQEYSLASKMYQELNTILTTAACTCQGI